VAKAAKSQKRTTTCGLATKYQKTMILVYERSLRRRYALFFMREWTNFQRARKTKKPKVCGEKRL